PGKCPDAVGTCASCRMACSSVTESYQHAHARALLSMSASLIGRLGSSAFNHPRLRYRCHSRARASLRNRHIGRSIMGFEDEVERSFGRPCRRQVQADMRTHLIHRPARDTIPPLGGARVSSYLWCCRVLTL